MPSMNYLVVCSRRVIVTGNPLHNSDSCRNWLPQPKPNNTAIDSAAPPLLNASISSASLAYIQLYNPSLCPRKTNERPQHRRIVIQIQCITFAMLNVGMSHGETLARSMTTTICNRANMSRAKNYALADVQSFATVQEGTPFVNQ